MAARLDLWCLYVVFLTYNFEADALYRIKTTCEYGLCLALYGTNKSDGIISHDARAACEGLELTAAAITDASVQDTVQRLLSGVPDIDDVWTAGFRRQSEGWSYINKSDFRETVSTGGENGAHCVFMRPGQMPSFSGDQCNEHQGKSYPFCQFTPTISGSCSTGAFTGLMYKNTCYYVPNHQPGDGGWYDAQTFCHTQLGGNLAHRHILDTDLVEQLGVSRQLWIDVTRYRWYWLPELSDFFPMQYFNWAADSVESGTNGRVAISSGDFTWNNVVPSTKLSHFICTYVDETYTTTLPTTTTTMPTTTTTVPTTTTQTTSVEQAYTASTSDDITTSLYPSTTEIEKSKKFQVGAVAGSVCAAVVVVAVVLGVLFILRKKKRKDKHQPRSSHVYVNEGASSAKHDARQDHEPELDYENVEGVAMEGDYSSVDLDQADNTDHINPYGECKPSAAKEPSTKYFQNTRPKPQAIDRDEDTPEVAIYAQPNKPAKGKKTIDGTRPKHKPTTKTGKPKLGSKKAAQVKVTHVEAPGGDIYAVSARSVGAKQQTSDVLDVL